MRILHLIDPACPGGGAHTLRLIADVVAHVGDVHHDVVVLGSRDHAALARRCGLNVSGTLCPPLRMPVLARRAFVRALAERERFSGRYDLIHGWTLSAGALAAPRRPPGAGS